MGRVMKDSGVAWIGLIPEDWNISKISFLYDVTLGKMLDSDSHSVYELSDYLCAANIKWTGVNTDIQKKMYFSESEKKQYLLCDGDVLIMEGGTAGTSCVYRNEFEPCYIQNSVHRCRGKKYKDNRFLYYWMYVVYYSRYIESICNKATIMHYTKEKVCATPIVAIPLTEKNKIVNFLEVKCIEIDSIISKTKTSIEEYQRLKKSIVIKAVTKGLNEKVCMKWTDSDWIGEIPAHWDYVRIQRLFEIVDERNEDENALLLSLYTAIGVKPRNELEEKGNKAITVMNYKKVQRNDVIVNKLLAWMGAIGYSDYDGVTSPDYDVYREKEGANVVRTYYNEYFRHTCFNGDCYKYGHGIMLMRWRTYPEEFLRIKVPNPPREEQEAIAKYLDEKCTEIDKLIETKELFIAEMEHYKRTIIYEYVTGKKEII